MIAILLRRALTTIPSLIVLAMGLFALLSLKQPPAEFRHIDLVRRHEELQNVFYNDVPLDRPAWVHRAFLGAVAESGESHRRQIDVILRIGVAGLVDIVHELEALKNPAEREAIALELVALARRMGRDDVDDLRRPEMAGRYFRRLLDEHGPDLRPPAIRRALRRWLATPDDPLYLAQIRSADTAALAPLLDSMSGELSAADHLRVESLAVSIANRAGILDVKDEKTLRTFWALHHLEYLEFDSLERFSARLTETRFGQWVLSSATRKFGQSWRTGQSIYDELRSGFPRALGSAMGAVLATFLVALPFAAASARRAHGLAQLHQTPRRSFRAFQPLTIFLLFSTPITLLYLALRAHGWLQRVLILVVTATILLPLVARHLRAALLEVQTADHVTTLRMLGASPTRVFIRAILTVASPSILAMQVKLVGLALGIFLVLDGMLRSQGLGRSFVEALRQHDVPWIMAFTLVTAAVEAVLFGLSDWVAALLDPRMRRVGLAISAEERR